MLFHPWQGTGTCHPAPTLSSRHPPPLSSRATLRDLLYAGPSPAVFCPFLSAQKKRTKRKHHPPKALPQGRDATAPPRRSFTKVCSDHQRSGMFQQLCVAGCYLFTPQLRVAGCFFDKTILPYCHFDQRGALGSAACHRRDARNLIKRVRKTRHSSHYSCHFD